MDTKFQPEKLVHRGKTYSLISLAQTAKNFSELDQLILNARCGSKSVAETNDAEIIGEIGMAIMQASLICGAETPNSEPKLKILCSEMESFLKDFGYSVLTFEEIVLAFKLNCRMNIKKYDIGVDPIEYTSRFFNVEYTSKVLWNYIRYRNIFEGKFRNELEEY